MRLILRIVVIRIVSEKKQMHSIPASDWDCLYVLQRSEELLALLRAKIALETNTLK